jgi:uncharacterized protein YjiS (DUF1127 family)
MNSATLSKNGFAPTVPLLGAQGWIAPPDSDDAPIGLFALVREWLQRSRMRSDIAELDDHLLRDVGLTRMDIVAESRKHFWQL